MTLYKLNFTNPLHIDSLGTTFYDKADEYVRSDTLSAALISCWSYLHEDPIVELSKAPPFTISSAFPYFRGVLFFPRPLLMVFRDPDEPAEIKKLKKIRWVSAGILKKFVQGELLPLKDLKVIDGIFSALAQEGGDWTESSETLKFMIGFERPRITVNRINDSTESGAFFYFSEYHFHKEAGLFFLARFNEEGTREKFKSVLHLLGDEGLGADRSIGKGTFKVKVEERISLNHEYATTLSNERWLLLSLLNPRRDEVDGGLLEGACYDLVSRSGWIRGTSLKRPPVKMLAEGSVFVRKPEGRVVDLFPEGSWEKIPGLNHPIFRDGRAFCLPMGGDL